MADLKIDDATLDTEVTGSELIPSSDGGKPRAIQTEKIKDFVLKRIAALASADKVDTSNDGVYLLKGGELKPVSAAALAAAVMDYAFALAPVQTITGNETVSVKDATVKKTLSLDMLKTWMLDGTVSAEEISEAVKSIENKVDKEEGKGLSDQNFTLEDKQKLEGLVSNAQADWEETDDTDPSFIRNKPKSLSEIEVDDTVREGSNNPVSSNAVADALNYINAVREVRVNGSTVVVEDGLLSFDTLIAATGDGEPTGIDAPKYTLLAMKNFSNDDVRLYVRLSDRAGNPAWFLLNEDKAHQLAIELTPILDKKANMFNLDYRPPDGSSYEGMHTGSFVYFKEGWDDGSNYHLAINKGDSDSISLEVFLSW